MSLLAPLFRWPVVEELFSPSASLQAVLDFEAALARAEAQVGVIPPAAATAIAASCRSERFDPSYIAREAATAGNLAIPLIGRLRAAVEGGTPGLGAYVHWGATSQDALDTALVLQLRGALARIGEEMDRLAAALTALARAHRETPMAGRTWMQQAVPITFGLEAAGWLDAVGRQRARLAAAGRAAAVLQLGGAAGSLAALGDTGVRVAEAVAKLLGLGLPALPWHTHRDRLAEVVTAVGSATATLGKIARDVALHAQTEVGELAEPAPGGSSTMPHKRNPVGSAVALSAATRVPALVASFLTGMVQEQQRGLGGWPAEWEAVPEVVGLFAGALHHLTDAVAGLEVDGARMRANLDATRGLLWAEAVQMRLRERMGAGPAQEWVAAACARVRAGAGHLRELVAEDREVAAHLAGADLDLLFGLDSFTAAAAVFVDRALAEHAAPAPGGK